MGMVNDTNFETYGKKAEETKAEQTPETQTPETEEKNEKPE